MIRPSDPHPCAKLAISVATAEARPVIGGQPQPAEDLVRTLLQTAADGGVSRVAVRPGGEAERQLGQAWPFPSPFSVSVRTLPISEGLDRVEARARRSLERMGLPRGDVLMVQAADDLAGSEGRALWDRCQALKARGLFKRVGLKLAMDDGPALMARRFLPDVVEIPCGLLDQRAERAGVLAELAELGCEVRVSGVFARGLLFGPREAMGFEAPDSQTRAAVSRVRLRLAEARLDPMQAALAYALGLEHVSVVLIGARSAAELRAVMAAAGQPAPQIDWGAFSLTEAPTARRVSSAA
ncbi:aldo/keto reductase [Brevundimonas sp.]|uniref:aldo/keto reductase n=1 Tax=Brevundimonas sp. TaxID=1871086 RepID=UPI0035AE5DB9